MARWLHAPEQKSFSAFFHRDPFLPTPPTRYESGWHSDYDYLPPFEVTMAYYEDLTPYEYFGGQEPPELKSLNVGWLSNRAPFSKGETSQEFKDRLYQFCLDEYVVHIARGFHVCELCACVSDEQWYKDSQTRYGEKTHWLNIGDGEIRAIGKSVVYAAPTLIYHYVVEHQYKPPDEFIEAVLSGPSPESVEHKALLQKFKN